MSSNKYANNWYHIPTPETLWLVHGLIPSDGHVSICGKPKSGKSLFVRNLIVSVVKGRQFLDRKVNIPSGNGRVLYVHLDLKDQPWMVTDDLKSLGITEEESQQIILQTADQMPPEFEERLVWLQDQVTESKPHMVVIDLMWQFVKAKNNNEYNAVLDGINRLQRALLEIDYKGALIVTIHGRKATNPEDPADDMLGSTAQRGSFITNIILGRNRNQDHYTILSDQTKKEPEYGEINQRVLIRNDEGHLELGPLLTELNFEEKKIKKSIALNSLVEFISKNPKCEMTEIMTGLKISKRRALDLLETDGAEVVHTEGEGVKGDPLKYFVKSLGDPGQDEAAGLVRRFDKDHMPAMCEAAAPTLPDHDSAT